MSHLRGDLSLKGSPVKDKELYFLACIFGLLPDGVGIITGTSISSTSTFGMRIDGSFNIVLWEIVESTFSSSSSIGEEKTFCLRSEKNKINELMHKIFRRFYLHQ